MCNYPKNIQVDSRIIWYKHIFVNRKQLGITLAENELVTWTQVKTLHKQKILMYKKIKSNQSEHRNTVLGYGFHF
jgi:hypothetical protein